MNLLHRQKKFFHSITGFCLTKHAILLGLFQLFIHHYIHQVILIRKKLVNSFFTHTQRCCNIIHAYRSQAILHKQVMRFLLYSVFLLHMLKTMTKLGKLLTWPKFPMIFFTVHNNYLMHEHLSGCFGSVSISNRFGHREPQSETESHRVNYYALNISIFSLWFLLFLCGSLWAILKLRHCGCF